jgi:type IX secretion system PorP/SprF family membrane protein
MKNKILLLVIIISTTFYVDSYAQQEAQYTQYMYNTLSFNPAYAGQRDVFSVVGLHRSQWVGLEGAPRTQTLSLHSPVGEYDKIGLGFSIVNDEIGPTHETNFDLAFSYKIKFSDDEHFTFGLKLGGHLLDVAFSELNAQTSGDQLLQADINNKFSPNFGFGLFYRNSDKWYLGLSAPNILETEHFENTALSTARERIHFYLMGGYVFNLSDTVKFKPAALLKAVYGAPLQADITGNFLFFDKLTLGGAYRWDAAFSGLAGFQVSDELMLGFAYDRETTALGNTQFNDGSYEVFLRFEMLNKKKGRIISPRFF